MADYPGKDVFKITMNSILKDLREVLESNIDPHTKATGQRFFREKISFYGIKTSVVSGIAKDFFSRVEGLGKKKIFQLCEELWRTGNMEESFIACHWSYRLKDAFEPGDFETFERWVNLYVNNWASCDTLCNHTVGAFVEMVPEALRELAGWAKSGNRWMRRAAVVALIIPARRGKFLKEIFEIADILLCDPDDLVQKGYGWMLKEAGRLHQDEVFEYVMKNKTKMPRTALRYAIEKMPPALQQEAMKKT